MDGGLNLSSSSSSDPVTDNNRSRISSSSTGEMITVNTTLVDGLDDAVDNDQALRELLDQRKRLAAELEAMEEGGDDGNISPMNNFQNGESLDDGDAYTCSNNDINEPDEMKNDEEEAAFYEDDFDDEIDKLLEESLANRVPPAPSGPAAATDDDKFSGLSQPPAVKRKVVLKHRGMEYFEVLPDGWIEVTHSSGIPVYLHKATRVCSLARPYFIGPGSVRNHDVPISAVPCYHQRTMRELETERENQKQQTEVSQTPDTTHHSDMGPPSSKKFKTPAVKVQTVEDFKNRNVNPQQLHEYCSRVFEFETINVMRFKSWSDHRAYRRRQKQQQQISSTPDGVTAASGLSTPSSGAAVDDSVTGRPSLPANVKLITVPDMEKGTKPQQKPFYLNPQGRTSIAVLHEYVQKVMKGSVSYEFGETRNAANPYCAIVRIAAHDRNRGDGAGSSKGPSEPVWTEYGKGEGNSKKNAKLNAAKQAMRVLVPGIEFNADGIADSPQQDDAGKLFDLIKITDSRVPELSAKAGQPTPFVILQECLKRHSSFGDTTIDMNIERIKHQQHEFTMKVGKHEVKVQCTNKKEGKQRAAQAMLEKLHPQITSWGSLIRLYGYGAQRKLQETRKEKDSIIRLQVQNNKQHHIGEEPNMAILEKLKQEMVKLYQPTNTIGGGPTTSRANVQSSSAVKNIDI